MSKTILFFGNERLATGVSTNLPIIKALVETGYQVSAVILAQSPPSKSRASREVEMKPYCSNQGITVIETAKLSDQSTIIAEFKAEAAILVAFGQIVPAPIIKLFPRGIINIHPSLLPKHRGPTPIESVILSGEAETGVSLMKLSPKMDSGPVYAKTTIKLEGHETKQALGDQLGGLGADLLISKLPNILEGSLAPEEQDEEAATYDQVISKADGIIDWGEPAEIVERQIRAYAGWPRSQTNLNSQPIIITSAIVENRTGQPGEIWRDSNQFGFYCRDRAIKILNLIPSGKSEMSAEAYLAGYKL